MKIGYIVYMFIRSLQKSNSSLVIHSCHVCIDYISHVKSACQILENYERAKTYKVWTIFYIPHILQMFGR